MESSGLTASATYQSQPETGWSKPVMTTEPKDTKELNKQSTKSRNTDTSHMQDMK